MEGWWAIACTSEQQASEGEAGGLTGGRTGSWSHVSVLKLNHTHHRYPNYNGQYNIKISVINIGPKVPQLLTACLFVNNIQRIASDVVWCISMVWCCPMHSNAVLCSLMHSYAVLCCPMHSNAVLCSLMHSDAVLCCPMHSNAVLGGLMHSDAVLCCPMHSNAVLCCQMHSNPVLCGLMHSDAVHSIPMYFNVVLCGPVHSDPFRCSY